MHKDILVLLRMLDQEIFAINAVKDVQFVVVLLAIKLSLLMEYLQLDPEILLFGIHSVKHKGHILAGPP